jgi:DNA (cytosine-5)-methyltransferase 1
VTAYYNENDPSAAAWLRELIKQGSIAPGHVDERSIADVSAADLVGFTQCHFFAGIGGWSLALRSAGWPDSERVWTGSCPCQPFSSAGKGEGFSDERHLWPDFHRLISECRPSTVFGEQVASPLGREWLDGVFVDLERVGYAVAGADLCAAGVGAPHIRQRLYWVGHSDISRWEQGQQPAAPARFGNTAFSDGDISGMANPIGDRWGASGNYHAEHDGPISNPDGNASGMAYTSHGQRGDVPVSGPDSENARLREQEADESQRCRAIGHRMAHAQCGRWKGGADDGEKASVTRSDGHESNPWSDYHLINCSDGKARRLKPGVKPLVNGFPARISVLRGFGNAIVPQVAAQFIKAFTEIKS